MISRARRIAAAIVAAAALGIGSAVWATSSASAAPADPPGCTNGQLAAWVNVSGGSGAAGTIYYPLELTNISSHSCTLIGYPGVSADNAKGKQLGDAARRNSVYAARLVTVPAGGTVHVLFGYSDAEVTTSGCKPTTASTLRVYPPNLTRSALTFFSLPVCTVKNHSYLSVSVVRSGTGI
jgi:hypothetical protein